MGEDSSENPHDIARELVPVDSARLPVLVLNVDGADRDAGGRSRGDDE